MGKERSEIDRKIALDARDWIVRLTAGDVGREEFDRFKAWRAQSPEHHRAFAREQQLWQLLQGMSSEHPPSATPALVRRRLVSRRTFLVGSAAAASAAAIVAPRLVTWMRSDFVTGSGEQMQATLPDGSTMFLNTNSSVAVDFRSDLRVVNLIHGEVELSVKPVAEKPFRVVALGGRSDSDFAVYAVRSDADKVTVTVVDGAVTVAKDNGSDSPNDVLLSAGQQTSYGSASAPLPVTGVDLDTELAWRTGRVVFQGKAFGSAVRELARYVPERLVMTTDAHDESPVSAVFQTRDAHAAIEALAHTQGLSVRLVPGFVIVIS
ncbi:FecR domain-containing protein [Aminobacter sp. AP02]|uniref:FecR family protein n=1 Tax=Aminobacter sp. AP02 TaxID=2135737 RepID=UPI000D6B564C|nr:FecR domain-containing protein [Aminobacter sp. AP02]PWK74059.1 FecR family protein [Aminobacter sp. AP02]